MKDINATIIINLKGKSEDELYKAVEYSRRKNIQKAIRSGITYEQKHNTEILKECYKINSKVLIEGGTHPKKYEDWIRFIEPDKNPFFVVKFKEKIIGCFAIKEITRRFYGENSDEKGIRPTIFANEKEYNDFRPNDLMYWATILYGLKNNYNFVDLGGWQINPRGHLVGVNSFKEKWGGEIFYYYSDYPVLRALGRKLIRKSGFLWKLNAKIKKKS
ncbi:MAG: hypothetical protein AABX48_00265 [Nanoarchaeota archaeon]